MTRPIINHWALKISLIVGTVLSVSFLVDVLPYYDFCFGGYDDGYFPIARLLYVLALLALLGWTGADIWTWLVRAPERDHWLGSALATLALFLIVSGAMRLGSQLEIAAVERFTERMEPTVAAIEDHVTRHGSPPKTLARVTTPPDPGLCSQELTYEVEGSEWALSLTLVDSPFRGEWIRYRSNGRFKELERVINGWGWGRWVD